MSVVAADTSPFSGEPRKTVFTFNWCITWPCFVDSWNRILNFVGLQIECRGLKAGQSFHWFEAFGHKALFIFVYLPGTTNFRLEHQCDRVYVNVCGLISFCLGMPWFGLSFPGSPSPHPAWNHRKPWVLHSHPQSKQDGSSLLQKNTERFSVVSIIWALHFLMAPVHLHWSQQSLWLFSLLCWYLLGIFSLSESLLSQ